LAEDELVCHGLVCFSSPVKDGLDFVLRLFPLFFVVFELLQAKGFLFRMCGNEPF